MSQLFAPIHRARHKRKDPTLREKLACVLLDLLELQGDGIPREHAKQMTADQIISLFQFDHAHRVESGGGNHPTNLTARLIKRHREKTAKVDVPQIRKGDRLAEKEDEHRLAMRNKLLAPPEREQPRKRKGKSRWNNGRSQWPEGRKLRSANRLGRRSARAKSKSSAISPEA